MTTVSEILHNISATKNLELSARCLRAHPRIPQSKLTHVFEFTVCAGEVSRAFAVVQFMGPFTAPTILTVVVWTSYQSNEHTQSKILESSVAHVSTTKVLKALEQREALFKTGFHKL